MDVRQSISLCRTKQPHEHSDDGWANEVKPAWCLDHDWLTLGCPSDFPVHFHLRLPKRNNSSLEYRAEAVAWLDMDSNTSHSLNHWRRRNAKTIAEKNVNGEKIRYVIHQMIIAIHRCRSFRREACFHLVWLFVGETKEDRRSVGR